MSSNQLITNSQNIHLVILFILAVNILTVISCWDVQLPFVQYRGCFDVCEDDIAATSPTSRDSVPSDIEQQNPQQSSTSAVDREVGADDGLDPSHSSIAGRRKFSSGSLLQEYVLSPRKLIGNGDR